MSPLDNELSRINGQINRWRAFEHALFGLAVLAGSWFVLALIDMGLRPRGSARLALSLTLIGVFLSAGVLLVRILNRQRTPAAVAALLEHHFPQLDNHLINRVLFASATVRSSPWLRGYVNAPVPGWESLPFAELKNRQRRRIGAGAIGAALLLLIIPALLYGQAWTVALRRVANPFSTLTPPTFAKVLGVTPGTTTVIQGAAVELSVRAKGRAGQSVTLELTPADDTRSLIQLGTFDASDAERIFVHTIPKLAAPATYRFRVGDAWPTDPYTLTTVPPLAVTSLRIDVAPPAYTRLPTTTIDALTAVPDIPAGATVTTSLALNRAAVVAELSVGESPPIGMTAANGGTHWHTMLVVTSGAALRFNARDAHDTRLDQVVRFTLVADAAPTIQVTAPTAKAALPPGTLPYISFTASDDYGLDRIVLEKIPRGAKADAAGTPIAQWSADGDRDIAGEWSGTLDDLAGAGAGAFRLVVTDSKTPGPANRTVTPQIVFEQALITEQYQEHLTRKSEAQKTLGQLILWQRGNMVNTAHNITSLPIFDPNTWSDLLERQREIRAYATDLLHSSAAALGTARVVIDRVREPMSDAVAQFERVQGVEAASRAAAGNEALNTQKLILRLLTLAQQEAAGGQISHSSSGLMAIIDALLKGQTETLAATEGAVQRQAAVSDAAVERQQALVLDLSEMIELARRDAGMAKEGDPLRDLMNTVADKAEELRIKMDMLRAAQALQNDQPERALVPQAGATNSLHTLKRLLSEWKAAETETKTVEALETLRDARDAVKKLEKLQAGIVDALRATESQGDKTNGNDDELLEEVVELKAMMAAAMLKVATDLQALPELDAANELVTDCYQIYEAMAQVEGSEKTTEATELGLQKEDYYLEMMAQTGQKLDEMEHWLSNIPDDVKRNMENFDQAEIQSAIPAIGMPEELQDLIGDLLEEQEELADKADDSITNQGDANPGTGWEIAEGETVSYSAAGKSGNRKPDHKEQDGRSQVGRAGMADGEVMAKSGRINEGDDEIDKRRTKDSSQSGDIEEEGHADAKATGGGKNAGYSDAKGMAGTEADARRESKVKQSNEATRQADLARLADTVYAKAQLSGLKIPAGFNNARENMKRAAEAGQAGRLMQMREFQNRAIRELVRAQSSLDTGFGEASMGREGGADRSPDAAVSSTPDEAPAEYREMVSEYFKAIGELK